MKIGQIYLANDNCRTQPLKTGLIGDTFIAVYVFIYSPGCKQFLSCNCLILNTYKGGQIHFPTMYIFCIFIFIFYRFSQKLIL